MPIKLHDAELKIMEILWQHGEATAKHLAEVLAATIGWKKTTTYIMLKRCVEKGAVARHDPGFVCRPLITLEEARAYETGKLISKLYNGAGMQLAASLLSGNLLTRDEIERLKQMVREME